MTTEKKIVRELGSSERMMNAFHDAETFLLAQAIFIISKEPVTSDLIRGALKRLMVKIPCLKLTIVDRVNQPGKDPKPVYVENPNMRIPLETNEETDWIRQMSREWKRKYDLSEGPLWRAIHLPNVVLNKKNEVFPHETVIIFDFLHTIIDGMSYQRLFGEFLRCLEEVRRGEVADPEPGTVSLPLEHYMPHVPRWKSFLMRTLVYFLFGTRVGKWLMSFRRNPYLQKFPIPTKLNTPAETSLVPLEFSTEQTSAIMKACKTQGVTVNGAVSAAATIALAQILEDEVLTKQTEISTYSAISVRRLNKDIQKAIGLFSDAVPLSVRVPPNAAFKSQSFWTVAKFYTESLHKAIKEEKFAVQHQAVDVFLQLLRSTGGSVKGLLPGAYGRNPEPLILTNMGYCNFLDAAPDANFKLVGRFGGHSDHNMGFIFTSNLNTFNGQICWTVLYSNHIVPVERAVKYATYVRQTILRFTLPDTEL